MWEEKCNIHLRNGCMIQFMDKVLMVVVVVLGGVGDD